MTISRTAKDNLENLKLLQTFRSLEAYINPDYLELKDDLNKCTSDLNGEVIFQ